MIKNEKYLLIIAKMKGWEYLSEFGELNEEFMTKYKKYLWWDAISCNQKLS